MTRNKNNTPLFNIKHNCFKNSFIPSSIVEWNKLSSNIRNSESPGIFRKRILPFMRRSANSTFQCHNPKGLKLITRLRLRFSHLPFHKSKHSFQDTLNLIFNCGTGETTVHYLLHRSNFSN